MDTKTKIIIIIASVAGIGITGAIVYYLAKPTPPPPITTTTTTSTGAATTSTNGVLSAIVSGVVKAI